MIARLWREESGQDLIEYALIAAFAATAAPAIWSTGWMTRLSAVFNKVEEVLLSVIA